MGYHWAKDCCTHCVLEGKPKIWGTEFGACARTSHIIKQMQSTMSGKPACPHNLQKCWVGPGCQTASDSGDNLDSFSPYRGVGTLWQLCAYFTNWMFFNH